MPNVQQVRIDYTPRPQLVPFHERQQRWAVFVCHRRFGKTTGLLADLVKDALQGPSDGRYGYLAPLYSQAKLIAWDILLGLVEGLTSKVQVSELRVDLINGSRIRLFGADNPDSLRGAYFNGVAIDEYADIKKSLFDEVIRPALADRKGSATFAGTPKGPNHFHELYKHAQKYPETWFTLYLPNSKTGILDDDEVEEMRQQMSPEVFDQEIDCSWNAPKSGSYYGKIIQELERAEYIGDFPHDPEMPVSAAFDLGWRDSTAVWYWQPRPGGYAIIDHDEAEGRTVGDWAQLLKAKGYRFDKIWLPHDARAKSLQTGRSTIEQMLDLGFPCAITPELSIQQGIDAVRVILPKCHFNEPTTRVGLRHLRLYSRLFNQKNQAFSNQPKHDEHSHSADAFRYFALVAKEFTGTPRKPPSVVTNGIDKTFQLEVLWNAQPQRSDRI